jgi:diketogulonate reductase-like aldo/keto reductase
MPSRFTILLSIINVSLITRQAGYRLFDGASDYGNEKQAGEGVNRAIKDGLVKREELCEYSLVT